MNEPYIKGINDKHLSNKFSELGDRQKEKLIDRYGSRKEARSVFKDARTRFAGNEVADNPAAVALINDAAANIDKVNQYGDPVGTMYRGGSPTFNEATGKDESYVGADGTFTQGKDTLPNGAPMMDPEKDNIDSYDLDGYGAGYRKGVDRLGASDLRTLREAGYGLQDIIDYSENITASGTVKQGDAARRRLDRYESILARQKEKEKNDPIFDPSPEDDSYNITTTNDNSINDSYNKEDFNKMNNNEGVIGGGTNAAGNSGLIGSGQQITDNQGQVGDYNPEPERIEVIPGMDYDFSLASNFGVGGDLINTIGKTGDTRISANNSVFGDGAMIGNDYSRTTGRIRNGNDLRLKLDPTSYLNSFYS